MIPRFQIQFQSNQILSMGSYRYRQDRKLTLPQQDATIRKCFSEFRATWNKGMITWNGPIQPTVLSDQYDIRINYRLDSAPKVKVLSPMLKRGPNDEPIPHLYSCGSLCLYLPRTNEWTPDMSIAATIIPWTYLWLGFYEFWQATGSWKGGGEHPRFRAERKRRP